MKLGPRLENRKIALVFMWMPSRLTATELRWSPAPATYASRYHAH